MCVMRNVSGCAMLPDSTVLIIYMIASSKWFLQVLSNDDKSFPKSLNQYQTFIFFSSTIELFQLSSIKSISNMQEEHTSKVRRNALIDPSASSTGVWPNCNVMI